jgi:tetratricopeptide (TPR) repeat protein
LLLLYTARPEFHPPWPLRAHHAQLNLNRLSTREVRTMVREVAARAALPDETVATVVERTAGVPLFVEELTRAVLETGTGKLSGNTIPVTLHDSLMARLDRLGPAKEVAQVGAVIGREFSYELLYAVHPIVEAELQQWLSDLADAELLYVHGIAPDATYQFKHALIRDAAYEALLKSRRKELHRRVARTINERFATFKESHPEVLARHWAEAGEIEPAISAWQKAGERAVAQRAFREAEQHYRDALTMLLALPESNARASRELTMQLALGGIMVATQGWSAIDTDTVYARAKTLAAQEGTAESVNVFYGLWATAVSRGELRAALVLADQTLEIARGVKRPHALVSAHFAQGATRMALGDLVAARQHLILAIEYYREEDFRGIADDHGVNARVWAGLNEWLLGYADSAERYTDDASALARRLNKPFALAYAEENGALTDGLRGDFNRASSASREAEKLGMELGFPILSAQGKILGSWARAHIGELSDAVDLIRAGLWELDAIKYYWNRGVFLTLLGEAHALVGAIDDAILTVEHVPQTYPDELLSHPLTLRLRGEMRLRRDAGVATRFDLAERDFREAIELARKMSAKSLELRATMSLAWLFLKQGKRGEGRAMLAAIYNWFTEGFDTLDLKDAKALLDELSR